MSDQQEETPQKQPESGTTSEQQQGAETTTEDTQKSPLNQYFAEVSERQKKAVESIFTSVIDRSCLRSCESQNLEEQMDLLMHCRQPLSFFPFFEHSSAREGDLDHDDPDHAAPSHVPYLGPRSCEYCGSPTTTLCPVNCSRPKLYFRKKRPPFAKAEGWDPDTEFELQKEQLEEEETTATTQEEGEPKEQEEKPASESSFWMPDFFKMSSKSLTNAKS